MSYRLHIDVPLNMSEEKAAELSEFIVWNLENAMMSNKINEEGVPKFSYRLGHDEDRQKSNYLIKTESGHVTTKKSEILLDFDDDND